MRTGKSSFFQIMGFPKPLPLVSLFKEFKEFKGGVIHRRMVCFGRPVYRPNVYHVYGSSEPGARKGDRLEPWT